MSTHLRFSNNSGKTFIANRRKIAYLFSEYNTAFILTLSIIVSIFIYGFLYYQSHVDTIYRVYVDGREIGTVNTKSIVVHWGSQYLKEMNLKYNMLNLELKNDIEFVEQKKYKGRYDNYQAIKNLKDTIEIQANGISIIVNGNLIGIVSDQLAANNIIEDIKQDYLPKYDKGKIQAAAMNESEAQSIEFLAIGIKEHVSFIPAKVSPDRINNETELKDILVNQGSKPLVTVETYEKLVEIERVPYRVVYHLDDSMYVNETEALSSGADGKLKVEYLLTRENGILTKREKINSTIIEEPTDKIILKGTKEIPDKGTGELIWPASGGTITSDFGIRWGIFHNGIDIADAKDLNIVAADHGTIKFTGWKTGYGLTVIIDHGNGFETLYAHLNSINVAVNEKIAQGQKLGEMGNTGRSTGTHLHFEIVANGEIDNPLKYLELN